MWARGAMLSSKYAWLLLRQLRKIWVRAVSIAVLAVLAAIVAQLLGGLLPQSWGDQIGANSVGQVLNILATSMLAVTTFSLSIAVSAFAAAANSATPRATALLQEDPTTQNVLATFLGAFLFSLVGIVALKAGYYTDSGELVLFIATGAVIVLVVGALLRWISHLTTFGRIEDTLDRVEAATASAIRRRMRQPLMGGRPQPGPPPADATPLRSTATGYVQHIDMEALSRCAESMAARLWLAAPPGSFVHEATPLLYVEGAVPDEAQEAALSAAITCGRNRDFDQDPRFGLIMMSEIASRALSPGVNDPGTAIDVTGRQLRILSKWRREGSGDVRFPRISVPEIEAAELLHLAFRPIARDGAGLVEVQVRIQTALRALSAIDTATFREPAAELSAEALARAASAGLQEDELERARAAGPD